MVLTSLTAYRFTFSWRLILRLLNRFDLDHVVGDFGLTDIDINGVVLRFVDVCVEHCDVAVAMAS